MVNEKFRLAGERNLARGRFSAGRVSVRQLTSLWSPLRYSLADPVVNDEEVFRAMRRLNQEKYQLSILANQIHPLLADFENRLDCLQKLDKQLNTLIRNKRKGK